MMQLMMRISVIMAMLSLCCQVFHQPSDGPLLVVVPWWQRLLPRMLAVQAAVANDVNISTTPATAMNGENYIPVTEGIQNYSIICKVTGLGGAASKTEWYIERPYILDSSFAHIGISIASGLVDHPADLAGEVVISGSPLIQGTTTITDTSHFLIKNVTQSWHMARLQCGTLNVRRTFILGIEVAPSVQNDSAAFVEGSNALIFLNVSGLTTVDLSIFPPINKSYTIWRYKGEEITTSIDEGITVGEYCINFTNISLDRAGPYYLSVSNGIESSTGYFALEIVAPISSQSSSLQLHMYSSPTYDVKALSSTSTSSSELYTSPICMEELQASIANTVLVMTVTVLSTVLAASLGVIVVLCWRIKRSVQSSNINMSSYSFSQKNDAKKEKELMLDMMNSKQADECIEHCWPPI